MYQIKKHPTHWSIRNHSNGRSRVLTPGEIITVAKAFPELQVQQVSAVYVASIAAIKKKPK